MYKIFTVATLLAVANAGDYQASSYSSFNDNHNSVNHIHSAAAPIKYAAPSVYAAPAVAKYVAPAAPVVAKYASPAVTSYYNAPSNHYSSSAVYAAPTVAKVALPVVAKVAPVAKYITGSAYSAHQEEYAPAQYEFAYAIQDPHTGDFHSQEEHRNGDHVVGQYSLHEADGTIRIVKYSDEGHGFNAVVERQGHPTEAPAVYKKVLAVSAPQYNHYQH